MSNLPNFPAREIFGAGFLQEAAEAVSYEFPNEDVIPAGDYISRLVDFEESVTRYGKASYDFLYDFRDEEGNEFHIRERFQKGSDRISVRINELKMCGINIATASYSEVVGTQETLTLSYDCYGRGTYSNRHPYTPDAETLRAAAAKSRLADRSKRHKIEANSSKIKTLLADIDSYDDVDESEN